MSFQPRIHQSSIRYSQEVLEVINSADGNTFADKFEFIALNYNETKCSKENELKLLDKQIKEKQKQLNEISSKVCKLNNIKNSLDNLFIVLERNAI